MPEVALSRRTGLGMITVRGDLADARTVEAVRAATGLGIPATRRIETGPGGAVAWMSPDEVLLLGPQTETAAGLATLAAGLAGAHHLAVDVSDARAVFRLEGFAAREALARGAPVDLSVAGFGPGDLRRTRLGQVGVAIWSPAPDVFEVACFRSVAEFVEDWLRQACAAPEVGFFRAGG